MVPHRGLLTAMREQVETWWWKRYFFSHLVFLERLNSECSFMVCSRRRTGRLKRRHREELFVWLFALLCCCVLCCSSFYWTISIFHSRVSFELSHELVLLNIKSASKWNIRIHEHRLLLIKQHQIHSVWYFDILSLVKTWTRTGKRAREIDWLAIKTRHTHVYVCLASREVLSAIILWQHTTSEIITRKKTRCCSQMISEFNNFEMR